MNNIRKNLNHYKSIASFIKIKILLITKEEQKGNVKNIWKKINSPSAFSLYFF